MALHSRYSPEDNTSGENTGVKKNIPKDHGDLILERIQNASHQANLDQLKRENKDYLNELFKADKSKLEKIKLAFDNKKQQLNGG